MSIRKVLLLVAWLVAAMHPLRAAEVRDPTSDHAFASLRLAINDLIATHGSKYPRGRDYLARLDALEPAVRAGGVKAGKQFESLRREAQLANPALNFDTLLVVRRKHVKPPEKRRNQGQRAWPKDWAGRELGLPSNHECYESTNKLNWDNEIATVSLQGPEGRFRTVFRPPDGGWVGELTYDHIDTFLPPLPNKVLPCLTHSCAEPPAIVTVPTPANCWLRWQTAV